MWQIEHNEVAQSDILALKRQVRQRILKFFRERVAGHPEPVKLAEPREGRFRGLHRFRIGDYRAVCHIQRRRIVVLVLFVDHRSVVCKRRLPEIDPEAERES